jgi:hypothetical protein
MIVKIKRFFKAITLPGCITRRLPKLDFQEPGAPNEIREKINDDFITK